MAGSIHWDLTKQATRRYLRDDVLARLEPESRARVDAAIGALDMDGKHFHDIEAVDAAVDGARIPAQVKADVKAIYGILAGAEASVHGVPVEQTHFHEVGNGEAVANVVAISLAIAELAPETITATSVQTGSGKVQCAHGLLDIPAPATAAILARGIPVCAEKLEGELCTPTSAAIIAHYVDSFE